MIAKITPKFTAELKSISTEELKTKLSNVQIPYMKKDVLLMEEGEFNGVFYPKQEIMSAVGLAEGASLVLDHQDTPDCSLGSTKDFGVTSWTGTIHNPIWKQGNKGEGMYGDLEVVDIDIARKMEYGARWGISPTTNYEANEVGDKVVASDLQWKSFSLVLQPAVRATMLNKEGGTKMSETDPEKVIRLEAELALEKKQKKYPYKYPDQKGEKENRIDVEESVLKILEERDVKIKELTDYKEEIEVGKRSELATELAYNEFLIGKIAEDEMSDRIDKLKEKEATEISMLSEYLGSHAELSKFTDFVKAFIKKNPGKTVKDAAAAWKKENGTGQMSKTELNKESLEIDAATAKLNDPDRKTNEMSLQELEKVTDADKAMADFFSGQGGPQ